MSIKDKIGTFFLQKEMLSISRNKALFNLKDAKTVGILFDASNKEEFELVKKYVVYLKELKKKVKTIGYFNSKEIPQMVFSKLEYDFFSQKQLNWYNKPSDPFIDNFINEEIDILIDLNLNNHFPLKYIATSSKAKFKVGKYSEKNKTIYDMLIDYSDTKGLKYFMRQIDIYLNMINNTTLSE